MIYVMDDDTYFLAAAEEASKATCNKAHCGTVIVKDGEIIGRGYNSPPLEDESQRTCGEVWDFTKKPRYDLTCCMHAEWRAILDACKRNPDKISGSRLYFIRLAENGSREEAGKPFCTVCSRLALDSGVAEFVLWNKGQAEVHKTTGYNKESYEYHAI